MDHIPIANLEAELGCFDQGLVDIGPRKDHGGSDKLFEVPTEAASCLEPASETKCVYPFGADGTLAWATPAGELLQLASCINGKLAGVDYRKSIEEGEDYYARTKMLQTALNLPQGFGYGIGLSLDHAPHPTHAHWVHNRWPRFIYKFHGLEVRLQYYVTSQSVVQQYQIRNATDEDIPLPYIISTDILFRNHELESETFRPVPNQKTSERLMLSQNLELLVSDEPNDVQFEIAVFLNKQRISIWRDHQPSDGENELGDDGDSEVIDNSSVWFENLLHDEIINKKSMPPIELEDMDLYETFQPGPGDWELPNYKRKNFAKAHSTLIIPRDSSQELCAIVKISGPLQPEDILDQPASKPISAQSKDHALNGQGLLDKEGSIVSRLRDEDVALSGKGEDYSFDTSDTGRKALIQLMQKRLLHYEALADAGNFKLARYYFFTASSIAKIVYKEDIDLLSEVQYRYAEFLMKHGWYSGGLKETLEDLLQKKSKEDGRESKTTELWSKVRQQLASMYLNLGQFSKAEKLYQESLQHLTESTSTLDPVSAPVWERIAWAKVSEGDYDEAIKVYTRFLDKPFTSRRTVLSNLGFLKRRLGQFTDAREFYERAINDKSNNDSTHETDKIFARSGLSSCLRSLRATPESIEEQSASSIKYIDINENLSEVRHLPLYSAEDHPFDFVVSRHLQILLSICSIPIIGNGVSGTMFVDADPVECAYEGRTAFFQFKFLIQYHRYLSKINRPESLDAERIQATCEDHLVWVFKIAPTLDTWLPLYSVGDAYNTQSVEHPLEEDGLSNVVEGAFHFLKLCLYHKIWKDRWELVLELLHPALEKWLSYLVSTQHMANLWVEDEISEILRPQHDSLSRDRDAIHIQYPEYSLSNFSVLWLALKQLEYLMTSIEHKINSHNRDREDTARLNLQKAREAFNSHRTTLELEKIRSKIINTFKIFPKDSVGEMYATDSTTKSTRISGGESTAFTGPLDNTPMSGDPRNKVQISPQKGAIGRRDQQLIVFRRSIKERLFEVQPTDITTLEAYASGMFENPQDKAAWYATINNQEERDTTTLWDTRLIALALLGLKMGHDFVKIPENKAGDGKSNEKSKEVVLRRRLSAAAYNSGCFATTTAMDDRPEQIHFYPGISYESLSVLMASLYEECQTLLLSNRPHEGQDPINNSLRQIPITNTRSRTQIRKTTKKTGAVDNFAGVNPKGVCDTGFPPEWMYHYPAFIHKQPLVIRSERDLMQLSSIDGLNSGTDSYNKGTYPVSSHIRFMVDYGVKNPTRRPNIRPYHDAKSFWAELLKPQTPDKAKKRLIELSSQDKDGALMCRLSSPQQERAFLSLFTSRNDALENFFGERADLKANLWETELHLGFYQLLDATDSPSGSPLREMPTLSQNQRRRNIVPVALSFRFVGDLQDRFWTCLFLSSETIGFQGLVRQYFDSIGGDPYEEVGQRVGQRKTLESFYVERMLHEMVTSTDTLLGAFKTELAPSHKSQSFDFIYRSSGLHFNLEAKEILQDVLQKMDLSIKIIEDWEKREDTRGFPSRWSSKDQVRYGDTLKHLTRECKTNLRKLHMLHNQLEEQRKNADQWYNNLMSYKQLQEAHASTRLAEDVRLFTYVTIIFLPLSFSSSLFSMSGTPDATTLAVMGPTTVIALVLTTLLLANMNLLNRKSRFWFEKAKRKTREEIAKRGEEMAKTRGEMASSENPSLFSWVRVSKELTEAAQLQKTGMDTKESLPAESKWWYFYFWLCCCFRWPSNRVRRGMWAWEHRNGPSLGLIVSILTALVCSLACALIFMVEVILHMMIDTVTLIRAMLHRTQNRQEDESNSGRQDGEETVMEDTHRTSVTPTAPKRRSVWVRILEKVDHLLESPPRPIDEFRNKYFPSPSDQEAKDPARGLPNTSTNPAGGTTTDATPTQAGDLV